MANHNEFRNVGSPEHPVSWLHERAVALLWDELADGLDFGREVIVRLESGEMSGNLLDGATRLDIPDDLTPIGGMYPDLALYDVNNRPVRTIEVAVTSLPDAEKVRILRSRGVDVAVVKVSKEEDLKSLVWVPAQMDVLEKKYAFQRRIKTRGRGVNSIAAAQRYDGAIGEANRLVDNLAGALLRCEPQYRRILLSILKEVDTLDSYHPLRPDNPIKGKLGNDAPAS